MTWSFDVAQRSIVQIRAGDNSQAVGTGFFVAPSYVLTCAHVVEAVLDEPQPGDELEIRVFREDKNRFAKLVSYYFEDKAHGADVALLRLVNAAPEVPIAPRQQLTGFDQAIAVKIFGHSSEAGTVVEVVDQGPLNGVWDQLEGNKTTGGQIEDGFSGAPVWCPDHSAWVGMVVAREEFREAERIGYMIPEEKLTQPLRDLRADSLYCLLARDEEALSQQIKATYGVCRVERKRDLAQGLKAILHDLNSKGASLPGEGENSENRLVLFATGLFLSNGLTEKLSQALNQWIQSNAVRNFSQLCNDFRQLQAQRGNETIIPSDPCLWILVQANDKTDAKKRPYQIDGLFVPDPKQYDAEILGVTASETYSPTFRKLANPSVTQTAKDAQNQPDDATAENPALKEKTPSWCDQYLRPILPAYFAQLEDLNVDLEQLTVEVFLPTALMNEGIELMQIPSEIGSCLESITQDKGVKVFLRSQRRLTLRSWQPWEKRWQKLQAALPERSFQAFVTSENEKSQRLRRKLKSALGFKLDYSPDTSEDPENREIGAILANGIPAALWVRCNEKQAEWQGQIDQQVLAGTIADIPQTVATLRQEATFIDEVEQEIGKIEDSSELGHRLSFLWENPHHVPPKIYYSDEAL